MAIHKLPIYVSIGKYASNAYNGKANKPKIVAASDVKPAGRPEAVLAILKFDLEIDDEILDPIMETGVTLKIVPPPAPSKTAPTKTVVKGIVAELHQMDEDVSDLIK